jgi:uncharacterized membrane protein
MPPRWVTITVLVWLVVSVVVLVFMNLTLH